MKDLAKHPYAVLSLVSITVTAIMTSVHHIYRLGLEVAIPATIITVLPALLMYWYANKRSQAALWIYGVLNILVITWFGFIDGFLDHVVKALGLQNITFLPGGEAEIVETVYSLWSPEAGNLFYEGTGILSFIASVFALYYGIQFVRTHISRRARMAEVTTALG